MSNDFFHEHFVLQDLLTRHEVIVAEVLEKKYTTMFDNYQQLLNSENDVTRSKALKVWAMKIPSIILCIPA